jgi:hypothetical protein
MSKALKRLTASEMGKMGAKVRHSRPLTERTAVAKKAAVTRMLNDPRAFVKMGELGGAARHNKSPKELARISAKAVETRRKRDPNGFSDMGRKGGEARWKRKK